MLPGNNVMCVRMDTEDIVKYSFKKAAHHTGVLEMLLVIR